MLDSALDDTVQTKPLVDPGLLTRIMKTHATISVGVASFTDNGGYINVHIPTELYQAGLHDAMIGMCCDKVYVQYISLPDPVFKTGTERKVSDHYYHIRVPVHQEMRVAKLIAQALYDQFKIDADIERK